MESALKHWKRKQDEMERKHRQLLHDEELKFEQAKLVVNQSLAADRNKAFQDFSFAPRPLHPDLRRSLDDFLETQYSTQMRNCVLTYKLRLANLEEEKKQHLEALNQEMRADLDRYLVGILFRRDRSWQGSRVEQCRLLTRKKASVETGQTPWSLLRTTSHRP